MTKQNLTIVLASVFLFLGTNLYAMKDIPEASAKQNYTPVKKETSNPNLTRGGLGDISEVNNENREIKDPNPRLREIKKHSAPLKDNNGHNNGTQRIDMKDPRLANEARNNERNIQTVKRVENTNLKKINDNNPAPTEIRRDITSVESTMITNVNVFPNPVVDMATISFKSNEGNVNAALFDMNGSFIKEVFSGNTSGFNQISVDMSNLPHGAYFVRIITNSNSETISIVK